MKYFGYIFLFFSLSCLSQQTGQYTQFTFNNYGYNPAAAGTNINGKLEVMTGLRKQWVGFDYSPASNFISANYTMRPERSYKRWHNAGIYLSQEKAGIFQNVGLYGSYTLHLPITNKYNMSFGIFAGVKRFSIARGAFSESDPVYAASSPTSFYAYPDFIPGIRLYSKKMFFDVSVQQVFKVRQVQGDKQIGNKSVLTPQLYLSYGRKFFLDNGFTVVPALNIHSSFTAIPSAEINLMAYYRKRIGVGATVRNKDFISGIVQIRIWQNVTAGFAYDYSLNRIHSTATNSLEFMIGITPLFASMGQDKGKHNVAKCPNFDF
ncbi:MAG: PorP/SprF family type IX secretion system membrane protein [Bacteroidota bacterium]